MHQDHGRTEQNEYWPRRNQEQRLQRKTFKNKTHQFKSKGIRLIHCKGTLKTSQQVQLSFWKLWTFANPFCRVHAIYILQKTKSVCPPPCFFACSTPLNQTELAEKVTKGQTECCWVKWAQNKQRSGTVSHMHNSRFADTEVGRTLNQLTTLRSSKLRADWPGSSKDGSPQCGGFPEGSSQLN